MSSKVMGWFDDSSSFFFFDIQMLMRKSDVFEVGPDTWRYTKNKAHVHFSMCKSRFEVFSFSFKVVMSSLAEFS